MDLSNCYVNIHRSDRDRSVHRIISLARLFEIFEERVNTLVKPILWDDPFENFIQGIKGQLPSGQLVEFSQRYDFYGQCWSLSAGSDAMWRIYSGDKQSVRIKVRIKKLVESLVSAKGVVLVGKVRYLHPEELLTWARRIIRDSKQPDVRLIGRTLLVKRRAFAHEQEVRLLCFNTWDGDGRLFRYRIKPDTFIENIVVDPRIPADKASTLIEEIREKTRFRGPILHSNLYAPPRQMVVRLGKAWTAFKRTNVRITHKDEARTKDGATTTWGYERTSAKTQIILPIRGL